MEKVKITQEQADALKEFNANQLDLYGFERARGLYTGAYKSLKDFSVQEFALLLCDWYEVEPEIEKGDYVYHEDSERIGRVYGIYGSGKEVAIHGMALPAYDSSSVRRATQKEKREYIKSDIRNDLGWITRSVIHDYTITNTDIYFSDNDKDIQLTVNARIEEEIK